MTGLFIHGWLPDTITSIVPGGWSVADEVMFYAVFPLLMLLWKRLNLAGAVAFAITAIAFFGEINDVAVAYGVGLPQPDRGTRFLLTCLWFPTDAPGVLFGLLIATAPRRRLPSPPLHLPLARA